MAKPKYLTAEATYTLPTEFETEIGRIIVRWAYFEDLVQWIVWDLLHLDQPYGRVAVREPRVTDRLDMIRDLAGLRGIDLTEKWAKIVTVTDQLEAKRNLVAHGSWVKDPDGHWNVEQIRGTYRGAAHEPKISRRIEPTATKVDLVGLKSISEGIEGLIEAIQPLYDLIHAKRPSSP